ncbi:hypothetical protein PX699_00505 [Sphingobium sp. H39-3-25]|uniref:hypothetical protein n=1 Tax=Sphingobium arseniciresistens TaxID=3030834 RepID=UPI0023B99110|nr:hypothetical protein [Sphingobium arseniciresistens]
MTFAVGLNMRGEKTPVKSRDRYAIGPLCMSISMADFEAWLTAADVGDQRVYATGPVLDQKRDVTLYVRELVAQGEILTHQRKVGGTWEYFAVRRNPGRDQAGGRKRSGAKDAGGEPEPETAAGRMLAILRRCVALQLPARTNAELAREIGLKDAEAARYVFNQLIAGGLIMARNMGPKQRRVVTIVATGKSTVRGTL